MIGREAAGQDRGVTGTGRRVGVGIMAIGIPGPFRLEAAKAARAKEVLPAREIITSQLVEDHKHCQARALPLGLALGHGS